MHSKAHYLFVFENEVQQGPFRSSLQFRPTTSLGFSKHTAIIARRKTKSRRRLKRLLRSKRIQYEGTTKGQASELINTIYNAATEGQVRRLTFYGINYEGLTKKEACVIIDDYIASHPDAENDYQCWKMNGCPPL
jgi:hypothetical protein